MTTLRLVLGDQLTRNVAALQGAAGGDVVLMAEVADETTYVKHHKQKIAFIFSAMRHFAEELRADGLTVDYIKLDARGNTGSIAGELARAVKRHKPSRVVITAPGEWRLMSEFRALDPGVPVEIRDDDRFFASTARFAAWAKDRKALRMEFFYREMRRESDLLMKGDEPAGGQWNYDSDNRKRLPASVTVPQRFGIKPDAITREVIALVAAQFADHFGDLEPFEWAVTRADALRAYADFLDQALPNFGAYQDAMASGEPFVFHAAISPYLNAGLLTPREVCVAAEREYIEKRAPLNAVEGFIRQILGWREYVRGVYWLKMPDYAETNALQATRDLPWLYWSGETDMHCMAEAIGHTRRHAYSHHIQRLMVTGNFALLAGIDPKQVAEWYLVVYADAYEWVELPNVQGMSQFADGGLLASKPYASSGAYIDRMSDFCKSCAYDVKQKSGPRACPFNYLYWAFLIRNAKNLRGNQRLAMPYRTLAGWDEARKAAIVAEAEAFLDGLATE
ncbi:cryptochrome/photolyase family protein [Rhodopseudomonas palustris]|uniref:Cryptochrome/photolyase family protein n=1 Tax=Rhodopseudomonas palustris TaxID=1076 RepID=A0A418VKN7_RHOPL|nr:cryptochrome/photolyase family protein [Rhodopseudomonas palustris]RJF76694.1 cryptochrome/photolyase family protein [Rhodopseudomonas palustris]